MLAPNTVDSPWKRSTHLRCYSFRVHQHTCMPVFSDYCPESTRAASIIEQSSSRGVRYVQQVPGNPDLQQTCRCIEVPVRLGGFGFRTEPHPAAIVTLCSEESPVSAEPGAVGDDMKVVEAGIRSISRDDWTPGKAPSIVSGRRIGA